MFVLIKNKHLQAISGFIQDSLLHKVQALFGEKRKGGKN